MILKFINASADGNNTCQIPYPDVKRMNGMRQSRKEAELERMMRETGSADRRESKAFADSASTEFAEDWSGRGQAAGSRNGRRHSPGARG